MRKNNNFAGLPTILNNFINQRQKFLYKSQRNIKLKFRQALIIKINEISQHQMDQLSDIQIFQLNTYVFSIDKVMNLTSCCFDLFLQFLKKEQIQMMIKFYQKKNLGELYLLTSARNKPVSLQNWRLFIHLIILSLVFFHGNSIKLQQNLIVNGNFSVPFVDHSTLQIPSSILGWQCTWICQLQNCQSKMISFLRKNQTTADCVGQIIDLNSQYFNEAVSQTLQLKAGNYILHFNYYYPRQNANLKQLKVNINNVTILDVKPQVFTIFKRFSYQNSIQIQEGTNILQFANFGDIQDGTGFKINNVSLYRITNGLLQQFLETFQSYSFINSFPSLRVVFRSIFSCLINVDRLQLYIYHSRIYSYNGELLILSVNNFLNSKSIIAVDILQKIDNSILQYQNRFANYSNCKDKYIVYRSFSKDYETINYYNQINQSFVYFMPFLLAFIVILNLLFKLFFQKSISLLFRKFDFYAIILIMMFDGNIQSITFHTFAQYKIFFSNCFSHKLKNLFIIIFFYILFFIVFGLLFWTKYHYGKKVKYLIDQGDSRMSILWGIVIDRGIICFLFGVIHQFLINSSKIQIFVIMAIEFLWIIKKIIYIRKGFNNEIALVGASIVSGICRIVFQISCFVYQDQNDYRHFINEQMHSYLIYAIFSASLIQIIIGLAYCFKYICKICAINGHKVANIINKTKKINFKEKKDKNCRIVKFGDEDNQLITFSFLYCRNGKPIKFFKNKIEKNTTQKKNLNKEK